MSEHGKRPPGSPRAPIVERARWFQLSEAASIGIEMAAAVGIGAGLGMYVERHWTHWSPWTTFIGLGIGLAAAVLAVIRTARNFSRVIAAEELFRGTLTQTSVYPREVVKQALAHNAAGVILAHNHPSGVAEPSVQDQALTRSLCESLALVDVKVLDHFIVAPGACLSFAERGLL